MDASICQPRKVQVSSAQSGGASGARFGATMLAHDIHFDWIACTCCSSKPYACQLFSTRQISSGVSHRRNAMSAIFEEMLINQGTWATANQI